MLTSKQVAIDSSYLSFLLCYFDFVIVWLAVVSSFSEYSHVSSIRYIGATAYKDRKLLLYL